jgi:hypothetical protein
MNPETIKKIGNHVLFCVVCLTAFYIGVGGLGNEDYNNRLTALNNIKPEGVDTISVREGLVQYQNVMEMRRIEIVEQQAKFIRFYPWIEELPDIIILLLTCCSFSLLGSYILIARGFALKKRKVFAAGHPAMIVSSFMTGLVVMGLSYLLPLLLINEGGKVRPFTLMFLSLFGGMYSNTLYDKLTKYVGQMFKID